MISKISAVILLVILSPLLLLISIIVFFDGGFPILFKQKRIGINNSTFFVYKFRTMKKGIPDIPTHLVENHKVLFTRVGPLLRRYSFDELPQLMNIIKGNMVFVGPRPALYNQDDLIDLRTKAGVQTIMPGVTGWAQINGRDELSISEKVQFDKFYLKNRSTYFDLKILLNTILLVLGAKGVAN